MPLITITLPEHALPEPEQQQLAQSSSEMLLALEGMTHNPKAQRLSWVYLNKYADDEYFIGGKPAQKPHYRFDVTVLKNTLNPDQKSRLTQELTRLTLSLENTAYNPLNAARIWVIIHEVEEGNWGGAGQMYSRHDLMNMMQPSRNNNEEIERGKRRS